MRSSPDRAARPPPVLLPRGVSGGLGGSAWLHRAGRWKWRFDGPPARHCSGWIPNLVSSFIIVIVMKHEYKNDECLMKNDDTKSWFFIRKSMENRHLCMNYRRILWLPWRRLNRAWHSRPLSQNQFSVEEFHHFSVEESSFSIAESSFDLYVRLTAGWGVMHQDRVALQNSSLF